MKKVLSLLLAVLVVMSSFSCVTITANAACAHTFGEFIVVREATCREEGEKFRECTMCGYRDYVVEKASHSVYSWDTIEPATCTKDGIKHGRCSNCGDGVTRVIFKYGHDYMGDTCINCGYREVYDLNYIPIYTIEDLRNIENNMNGNYLLMNDLDLTEATAVGGEYDYCGFGWKPIGSDWGKPQGDYIGFNGVFNGNGHTIKGMRINVSDSNPYFEKELYGRTVFVGLFAALFSGTVKNLNLGEVNINLDFDKGVGLGQAGAIVGFCDNPKVEFCSASGEINAVTLNSALTIGGLIGEIREYCTLRNNSNSVNIYVETMASAEVGGIAGYVNRVRSTEDIDSCFNLGSITCMCNSSVVGGLFGFINVRT